ncbi:hypothetical protein [Desulforegula conservatrix]|uniref:hypothetical protein n=1 Tax=Desulforegula conservatrix TaxID=153026 RepID=UPI0004154AE1|nr:hypothetical protein [Desulforegula conservatrix]
MTIPPIPHHKSKFLKYGGDPCENLYRYAEDRKRKRFEVGRSQGDQKYLDSLADEIKIRTKITQQEIFFIGEMLTEARQVVKSIKGLSFKVWVQNTFDFGYHTAINFCNVYAVCMGRIQEIANIPISVLYNISQPSFSDELRDFLFNSGAIEKLSLSKVKELRDEYQKNGINAIRAKFSSIGEAAVVYQQVKHVQTRAEEAVYKLSMIQRSLQNEGFDFDATQTLQSKDKHYEKGNIYQKKIFDTFTACIDMINLAINSIDIKVAIVQDGTVSTDIILHDSINTDGQPPAKADNGDTDADAVVEPENPVGDSDVVGNGDVIEAQFTETDKGK